MKHPDEWMNQCYCYLRVSGLTQIDGGGLDRQLQTIEHYARDRGYEIVRVFEEAISGTTDETERPAFREMIAEILSGIGSRTLVGAQVNLPSTLTTPGNVAFDAFVSAFEINGEHDGAVEFTATLMSAGAITYTASV